MAMILSAWARLSTPRFTAALILLVASSTTVAISLLGSIPAEVAIWARLFPAARPDLRSERAMWRADATAESSPPSSSVPALSSPLALVEPGLDLAGNEVMTWACAVAGTGTTAGAAAGAEASACTAGAAGAAAAWTAAATAAMVAAGIEIFGLEPTRSPDWAVTGTPRITPAAAPAKRLVATVPARTALRIQSSFPLRPSEAALCGPTCANGRLVGLPTGRPEGIRVPFACFPGPEGGVAQAAPAPTMGSRSVSARTRRPSKSW